MPLKYKLVAFDLDETLIRERNINRLARKFSFQREIEELRKKYRSGEFKDHQVSRGLARLLAGRRVRDVVAEIKKIKLMPHAREVVRALKKRGLRVVLVTNAFSPTTQYFSRKLGIREVWGPQLEVKRGVLTGRVRFRLSPRTRCRNGALCKGRKLKAIARKHKVQLKEIVAVGNGRIDVCMFRVAGLAVGYNIHSPEVKKAVDVEVKDLRELLGLVGSVK